MRLLRVSVNGVPTLTKPWIRDVPPYAILSHTWFTDEDEVSFYDILHQVGTFKHGYEKISFCNNQANKDKLEYFWADTCCINKSSDAELSEAINSMFKWYQNAAKCYVYLTDVHFDGDDAVSDRGDWITAFRRSRWFTRGWTLQELLAPKDVQFYSKQGVFLGSKQSLEQDIHEITGVPMDMLRGAKSLMQFSIDERLAWAHQRQTTKEEDKAYCLLGIFNIFLPLIYGEGPNAMIRLKEEIARTSARDRVVPFPCNISRQEPEKGSVNRKSITEEAQKYLVMSATAPETRCLLLYGLPGSGKTHTAQFLARIWILAEKPAYWFDASSFESLNQSYLNFSVSAGLFTLQEVSSQGANETRLQVHTYLERSKQSWLLIFDNYDVYQSSNQFTLRGAFPDRSVGSVVITSRNAGLRTIFDGIKQAISIQAMNPAEARELFCMTCRVDEKSLDEQSRRAVTRITSELLGDLPLAVAQAGAFVGNMINQNIPLRDTLDQYIGEYLLNRKTMLQEVDDEFIEAYGQSIVTLFNMAFSAIEQKNNTASKLLLLFCFYHHRRVSLTWFKRASETYSAFHRTGVDPESDSLKWFRRLVKPQISGKWSDHTLIKALELLSNYGLIDMTTDTYLLNIHPLIHAWSKIFIQYRDEYSVEMLARLAAAILCEVYNKPADTDLQQSFLLKTELWPHAEAWFNATQQGDVLPGSSTATAVPGYVYNRIGDYLTSHDLPPHHEARATVPKIRLLALNSELSRQNLSSPYPLRSLRELIRWLAERGELQSKIVRHMAFSAINALIGRVKPNEIWDNFDGITARAEVYVEEMNAASGDHYESVSIAKRGENYIDLHQDEINTVDQIRLTGAFLVKIACVDPDSSSRTSSFWKLLELYRRSETDLGKTHFVTISLLAQLAGAKSHNRSSDAISATVLTSGIDSKSDPLFKRARGSLIHEEMSKLNYDTGLYCIELYNLLSEKHRLECEQQGEWHIETLETEAMVLDQKVGIDQIFYKFPSVFGTDRWPTRQEGLVHPVEVAIALLTFKDHDRVKLLWPGYLSYLALVKQSEQVVLSCEASFREAAKICARQNMQDESAYLCTIATYVGTRNDRRPVNATMGLQFAEQIFELWQMLEQYRQALETGDTGERARLSSGILGQIRTRHVVLKESMLYLLIQYFLYLSYQDENKFQAVIALEMLVKLSTTVTQTFDTSHVLTYRFKVLEALTFCHYDMVDRAVEVEDFLELEMAQSLDAAGGDQWFSDADMIRTKEGKPLTKAWRNARMTGESVKKFANICMETLSYQYWHREWYHAHMRITTKRLLRHVEKLGIGSEDIPHLFLRNVIAFSSAEAWESMWTTLTVLSQAIAESDDIEVNKFGPRILPEVALKLLQWKFDRALVLLLDWFKALPGLETPIGEIPTYGLLNTSWVIASYQRLAYFRLKYRHNADQLSKYMRETQDLIEQIDGTDEQDLLKLKQNWEEEDDGWRKLVNN